MDVSNENPILGQWTKDLVWTHITDLIDNVFERISEVETSDIQDDIVSRWKCHLLIVPWQGTFYFLSHIQSLLFEFLDGPTTL